MPFHNISSSGPGRRSPISLPIPSSYRSASVYPPGPPRSQYQRPRVTRANTSPPDRVAHVAALEIRQPTNYGPLAAKNEITDIPYPSPPPTIPAESITTSSPPGPSSSEDVKSVPIIPLWHHDAFIPDYPRPLLSTLTPSFLEDKIETRDRDMIIRDVSEDTLYSWETLHPEVRETSPLRYEYDSYTSRFIVKCATSPAHESVTIFFTHQVSRALESRLSEDQYLDMVQVSSGACMRPSPYCLVCRFTDKTVTLGYRGFNGNGYTAHSKKLPDAYVHIDGYHFPTVVCETGWAEKMDDLKRDARLWLLGTQGQTRVVVVVAFNEIHAPVLQPVPADATDPAATDAGQDMPTGGSSDGSEVDLYHEEMALLASINRSTEFLILAEALLSLNHQQKLQKPLLGSVVATVHLFRATPAGDGITEYFSCTLLPLPIALDAPQNIPLTLGDLLSPAVASAHDLNPDEPVLLPLARLRAIVAKQLPKQESERSMDRAMALMKKRGVWENLPTFAQDKRTKRKRDNEDVE